MTPPDPADIPGPDDDRPFRALAESMPQLAWMAHADGDIFWYNRRWYEYTGSTFDAMQGWGWQSVHHPDELPNVMARWQASIATGESFDMVFPLKAADGSFRPFLTRVEPVKDGTGSVLRWFGTNTDVSDQTRAEQLLRESEARLQRVNAELEERVVQRARERGLIWQLSPDLLGTLNHEGVFETSNPAWQATLGWSEQELSSIPFTALLHPDDGPRSQLAFEATQRGEPVMRFVNRYRHKNGSFRWISWLAIPEGNLVYCSGRDVTEERERAQALERAEDALRQSQKMEAVGQLTGGLAHDFNNLLAGISGSLEVIERSIARGRMDNVERFMVTAKGAVKRAAALTHRLLAFSRRQTLDPKPTNVNRLVGELEELVRRTVGPAIHVEVVGAGGLWSTLVDPNQLENALLNLCINARDAMPDGGRLTIETANKWLDDRAAGERDLPPGQYVALCVTDTGVGMADDVIEKAFDPFFTTKPLGEGTGLGLSMTYGFARQSGGQVRIYSEVAKGTTVCIYLPRHGEAETERLGAVQPFLEARGTGQVVLVVDDEPSVRMLINEVLDEAGYGAIEASDGPSGLKALQAAARIDLLITDVGLPGGLNGRQVADAARAERPGLKVLFITGYAENAVIGNGHLQPGMAVLTKPFAMDALARKIQEMLAG